MMKVREVIVVGAGITGCAVSVALARRGVAVTILTSPHDQRHYQNSSLKMENLEENLQKLYENGQGSRSLDQLLLTAREAIKEFISPDVVDRFGNLEIHRFLQEQLKDMPNVEWLTNHHAFELLTLEAHSAKRGDLYRRPTCLGVLAYNSEAHQVETLLAKETILATGGVSSLFSNSINLPTLKGGGFAMAHRAGAHLVDMYRMQFHPLAIYTQDKPCIPLPITLLQMGGRLQTIQRQPIGDISIDELLSERLFDELSHSHGNHLWLDLTSLNPLDMKEQFAETDAHLLSYGFNFAKDLIPVVPVAQYTCGGILVDKVAQTTLQRLRAVGEVSCTGLTTPFSDPSTRLLEGLTWALACAEDLAKQVHKFVYYFPEMKAWSQPLVESSSLIQNDWHLLREIMWHYIGIKNTRERAWRGYQLIERLKIANEMESERGFSIERQLLINAFQTAVLMATEGNFYFPPVRSEDFATVAVKNTS